MLNFVQKWLILQRKKLKFSQNLSKVSGKEQKIQRKTEKSSKNRLILQGKKSKFSQNLSKVSEKIKKSQFVLLKNLHFQGKTEKIRKSAIFG